MQLFFQLAEHLVFLTPRGAWDTPEARALRGAVASGGTRRLAVDQYLRGIEPVVREEESWSPMPRLDGPRPRP